MQPTRTKIKVDELYVFDIYEVAETHYYYYRFVNLCVETIFVKENVRFQILEE